MHPDYLTLYMSEIRLQHHYAHTARTEFNRVWQTARVERQIDLIRIYSAAQMLLTCGAQISKLLWVRPSSKWSPERTEVAKQRAQALRELLMPDEILKHRNVRNSVEHFDERLDVLVEEMRGHEDEVGDGPLRVVTWIDLGLAVREDADFPNAKYLRNIDPTTLIYTALDEDISLLRLLAAIDDVARRATEWLTAHEPPPITPEEVQELRPVQEQFDMLDLSKATLSDVAQTERS